MKILMLYFETKIDFTKSYLCRCTENLDRLLYIGFIMRPNEIFSIRKETEFFSFYNKQIKRDYHINCINKYSKLFSDSNNYKYKLDVSTTYLHHPDAIKNIKRFVKDVKILICLRNLSTELIQRVLDVSKIILS